MVKLLIYLKHHLSFIWNMIEWVNSFLFGLLYGSRLKHSVVGLDKSMLPDTSYKVLEVSDMPALADFFNEQPQDAFKFFKPHKFDLRSLQKQNREKAFLMLGWYVNEKLAGYAFLRFFANRQAFRGKIVSPEFQGRGIAKEMGRITTEICRKMKFRLFATISKDNVKSIASSKAVNDIRIVKELEDNYIYVEYLLKNSK